MKKKSNRVIRPEDEKFAYNIWRKSTQDNEAIRVLCDLFSAEPQEVRRVINKQHLEYINRIRANTESNRSIYQLNSCCQLNKSVL